MNPIPFACGIFDVAGFVFGYLVVTGVTAVITLAFKNAERVFIPNLILTAVLYTAIFFFLLAGMSRSAGS